MNIPAPPIFSPKSALSRLFWGWFLCLLIMPGLSFAQEERAKDVVTPVVTRDQYRRFCDSIGIRRDQWEILDMIYRDYAKDLTALIDTTDEAADEAGRDRLHDALAGKLRLDREELNGLRLALLECWATGARAADDLVATLLLSTEAMIENSQWANYETARRSLRREILLHPRNPIPSNPQPHRRNSRMQTAPADYAGEGLDLCLLVEDEQGTEEEPGSLAKLDAQSIASMLEPYAREMDRFLTETTAARRGAELARRRAGIEHDDDAYQRAQRELMQIWRRQYELNEGAAKQIGDAVERVAEGSGGAMRDAWLLAFDRACFPRVFRGRKPDRIYEWIMNPRNKVQEESKLKEAAAAYANWHTAWLKLARLEMKLMKRGRLELHAAITPMMDPMEITGSSIRGVRDLYEEMLRLSGRQSTLEAEHTAILEALLDDEQRQKMNRAIRRGRRR